jgi:hypothetical protein
VTRAHHVPPRHDGLCQPLLLATICALTPHPGGGPVILLLYVDDLFLTKDENLIVESKRNLDTKFEMKYLGMMHYLLGLEVWHRLSEIFLNQ